MMTTIIAKYGSLNNSIKNAFAFINKVAKERKLYFSKFDEVGSKILAIDNTKMQLLYTDGLPGSSCLFVDLNELQECKTRKQYEGINAGDLNKKKISDFLKSISLNLRFRNGASPVDLPLYESQDNYRGNVEQLELKAKKWTALISKLRRNPNLKPL